MAWHACIVDSLLFTLWVLGIELSDRQTWKHSPLNRLSDPWTNFKKKYSA